MSRVPQQTVVIQQLPSTSGLAIAGLIFSILGWFTCGFLCIPGAFFCLLALFSRGPKGTAIAGLIVGFPGTLFFAFVGLGLIMGFLGLGAAATSAVRDADRARADPQTHQTTAIPTPPGIESNITPPGQTISQSVDAEVDRIFSERMAKYEQELAAWNESLEQAKRDKAELPKLIDEMEGTKPTPPSFHEREWRTEDGQHKTTAVFVEADNETATLQKPDGTSVTVQKSRLDVSCRIAVEVASSKLSGFRRSLNDWTARREELTANLQSADARIASAESTKPRMPTREEVAAEVAAEEAKKREQEKLAKTEAGRVAAEAERKREAEERAAAARRAEEEYDADGLVLLNKTVKGEQNEFGGEITGMVVNRRGRRLNYAEITFSLIDESGAQVGTAIANINGLEPGGTWSFRASSLGVEFAKYKFSELKGF